MNEQTGTSAQELGSTWSATWGGNGGEAFEFDCSSKGWMREIFFECGSKYVFFSVYICSE